MDFCICFFFLSIQKIQTHTQRDETCNSFEILVKQFMQISQKKNNIFQKFRENFDQLIKNNPFEFNKPTIYSNLVHISNISFQSNAILYWLSSSAKK